MQYSDMRLWILPENYVWKDLISVIFSQNNLCHNNEFHSTQFCVRTKILTDLIFYLDLRWTKIKNQKQFYLHHYLIYHLIRINLYYLEWVTGELMFLRDKYFSCRFSDVLYVCPSYWLVGSLDNSRRKQPIAFEFDV